MKKLKLYEFRSINEYEAEALGLGKCHYFNLSFHDRYYEEKRKQSSDILPEKACPTDSFWGTPTNLPMEEPILFVTDEVEDEHVLDESIDPDYKENMERPEYFRMPLIFSIHRGWVVRQDLFEALSKIIPNKRYNVFDAKINNGFLQQEFTNYVAMDILNSQPNMDASTFVMNDKNWKVPRPEFSKMVFDKEACEMVLASEFLYGGSFVTEEFKNRMNGFSNELHFSYQDFDNSELGMNVYVPA